MTASAEPQPVGEDGQPPNPILAAIRRVMQQIEDSKLNLFCSAADEEYVTQSLVRQQMLHRVNVWPSPFCKPGVAYVAAPTSQLLAHPSEVS